MKTNKWLEVHNQNLKDKTIIITGADSGLGFETAFSLVKMNAKVVFACRNLEKAKVARNKILKIYQNGKIEIEKLDLANKGSIDQFCFTIKKKYELIDAFILNAGVYTSKKGMKTIDGYELTFGTNYLGNYFLVQALKDKFIVNHTKLIFVSSLAIYSTSRNVSINCIDSMKNKHIYGFSKLCLSRFAYELDRQGLQIRIVHPGICKTNIMYHKDTGTKSFFAKITHEFMYLFTQSVKKSSLTILYALLNNNNEKRYVTPRGIFSIFGLPKQKNYPSCFKKSIINETKEYLKSKEE